MKKDKEEKQFKYNINCVEFGDPICTENGLEVSSFKFIIKCLT